MRPITVAVATYGVATCVATVGACLDLDYVQHCAQAATMFALAACTAMVGDTAPRPLRQALLAFSLLLAASALVDLAADGSPDPTPTFSDLDGCTETGESTEYWRGQLRTAQLAEILRFTALACAFQAVRMLPRPARPLSRGGRAVTALALTVPVLVGLSPFLSASDVPALLTATAPGILSLTAAVALAALTVTRTGGRPTRNAALTIGAALMLVPAVLAVEALASYREIPVPESGVHTLCFYGVAPASPFWLPAAALTVAVSVPLLIAPALFTWAVFQTRSAGKPTPEP